MIGRFRDFIERMDVESYARGSSPAELLLARSGPITVDYAPFDYIPRGAKLAILGLTPGRVQAANALRTVQSELRRGSAVPQALRSAKSAASFSGTMRNSLVAMLDHIGVAEKFGCGTTAEFFHKDRDDVHFTSCLRYPVYVEGKNFSGAPSLANHPKIMSGFSKLLSEEAGQLAGALWIPLGRYAEAAILALVEQGTIDRPKVLMGLPHPSGANAERIAYFLGRKPEARLSTRTNASKIDRDRQGLLSQVASL